ncbi:hypothetical protein [Bacillus sp. FJAT-47783]|uniref:hypothetical protein n=1 Tax=Bacillus sp. FJAT-47783 TaxID=2922712 RepID=UPI001FAC3CCB|nr:hypothetical protein [Bacillus sp. FJAT-47783]
MERKVKVRLWLNLFIIFIALIIGLKNYPSELANFAFMVCVLGFFFTLPLFLPYSNRVKKIGFVTSFLAAFIIIFFLVVGS